MCSNNRNPSETQPLLEEDIETGQERQRVSKFGFILVVVVCLVLLGAGLSIYYAEGK